MDPGIICTAGANRSNQPSKFRHQCRKLIGALAPALVESHLLVCLAVGDRPVPHSGGVASLTALVLEGQNHSHERLLRWLPCARIGICEYQPLVRHDIEIDTWARHVVAVEATHHDLARPTWPYIELRMWRRPRQRCEPLLKELRL